MSSPPDWVAVGLITRAHGVKGEVSVRPLSQLPVRFQRGARVFLGESEERSLTVAESRPHRHRMLVSFEEIRDRDAAERLRGEYLFVPASWAPELPEGEFWAHDLLGCEVVTTEGRPLGSIREVVSNPANDVWAVRGSEGEVLVPALKDVVAEVDLAQRRVVVHEVPGLTSP